MKEKTASAKKDLSYKPQWSIFFDFHTVPSCPDVGKNFDVDEFTDQVKECGVDYIVFPARCNMGVAYYNTKIGKRHPTLKYDLLGKLTEACKKKDIKISAYINVGLSHDESLEHRDWLTLTPEGYTYSQQRFNHFFRTMCYNTGYSDHLLATVKEFTANYDIAGIFCDCMGYRPCIGAECVREMKERGMDWNDAKQQHEFAKLSTLRMAARIKETAEKIKPNLLLYFNGPEFGDQKNLGTYFEYECLPTGGWGYDILPVYARHLRKYGKHVINMTARFHKSWGDFGGIRKEASLEYDCVNGLSNGMRPTVGDHYHPRGDLKKPVFNLIKNVYKKLQKYDPWYQGAEVLADTAFVVPGMNQWEFRPALQGAVRMLAELKTQFDVLTPEMDWSGYKTLIVAENYHADEILLKKVKEHLKNGGTLFAVHEAFLDKDKNDFALKELGLKYEGQNESNPSYLIAKDKLLKNDVPDMVLNIYEKTLNIKALKGTKVLAEVVEPVFSEQFDGEHYFGYQPPDESKGCPAVTMTDKTAYFSYPVFSAYFNAAPPYLKQMVSNILKQLLPAPLLRTANMPSFTRATVTAQKNRRMVHILSYVPERRGKIDVIEEAVRINNVSIELRADGRKIKKVYLAPDKEELDFKIKDGYIKAIVPEVDGYAMLVFEE